MEEYEKGWNERRFFSFNLNPQDKQMAESKEPESYLTNPKTNPARYEEPVETGEELKAEKSPATRATPANPSTEPSGSVADSGEPPPAQISPLGGPLPPAEPPAKTAE